MGPAAEPSYVPPILSLESPRPGVYYPLALEVKGPSIIGNGPPLRHVC
jgi:hypothetical protein